MSLTERQKKYLRGLAHQKKAIVMIGNNGITDNVMAELENALTVHELIKIKVRVGDRQERDKALQEIVSRLNCLLIQRIGNSATLYRKNPENPKVQLPRA